jgi:hypothetical protein
MVSRTVVAACRASPIDPHPVKEEVDPKKGESRRLASTASNYGALVDAALVSTPDHPELIDD